MQMTVSPVDQPSGMDFLKLTMFLVSNNFVGPIRDIRLKVYQWIREHSSAAFLECLLSMGLPTSEALTEHLFQLAIDTKDTATLKKILGSGFDFSEQVYHDESGGKLTPLQHACKVSSTEIVQLLLKAGADINSTLCPEKSVLKCAAMSRSNFRTAKEDLFHACLIRILLHAGAKANTRHGASALHLAATAKGVEAMALLIAAGADVTFTDEYGRSALFEVVGTPQHGWHEGVFAIARKLIQAGADVQAITSDPFFGVEETLLQAAIRNSRIDTVQLLLDAGAMITEGAFLAALRPDRWISECTMDNRCNESDSYDEADSSDEDNSRDEDDSADEDMVKLLLSFGARVTPRVIEQAVQYGNSELVFSLLESAQHGIEGRLGETALIKAIHDGKTNIIERLNSFRVSLTRTPDLEHAMATAAGRGDVYVFQLLLGDESRYRATVIDCLGPSLYPAIARGRKDVTKLLLEAGAVANETRGGLSRSLLSAAIRQKDAHLARTLMNAGAEVNEYVLHSTYTHVRTVLPAAVEWGYRPLILDIIGAGAEVNAINDTQGKTALAVAVEKRDKLNVQTLIEAGSDVNAPANMNSGRTALIAAVQNNDIAMVGYLLGIGAHIDERSLVAAVSANVELMQMLLSAHSMRCQRHPMGYGCAALQKAVEEKKNAMVETLLASGIDTNTIIFHRSHNLESAFGVAIRKAGNYDPSPDSLVQMLLRGGANPNGIVSRKPNKTALLASIDQNNLGLVKILIEAGADVNADLATSFSRTPLQQAVENGRMDIVRTVLEHGADVNAPPCRNFGATALQLAAIGGYVGIACLLLERGAEINAEPAKISGRTALEGAAEHGRIDMLQLLLSAGALIIGPGAEQYERARKLATENGYIAARRLLESYHSQLSEGFAGWDGMTTDVGVLDDLQF
jgi:ankyrin repeat protein